MRDGVPLPARTTPQLLSQLAYRVFGPLGTARARAMLEYHGLRGAPAGSRCDIATRYGSPSTRFRRGPLLCAQRDGGNR